LTMLASMSSENAACSAATLILRTIITAWN
jgi:hypothetical protein